MKKNILLIVIVGLVCFSLGVGAAIVYKAEDISYTNIKSEVDNVQDAIEELANHSKCKIVDMTVTNQCDKSKNCLVSEGIIPNYIFLYNKDDKNFNYYTKEMGSKYLSGSTYGNSYGLYDLSVAYIIDGDKIYTYNWSRSYDVRFIVCED